MKLRMATRRSKLALTQARWVAARLREAHRGLELEEVHVVTQGDRVQDVSLRDLGGKGLFVSEVEAAVARGEADFAVHSLKDVPAELAPGLTLACVPEREDPRDVLVTPDGFEIDDLSAGDRVGTGSARRSCQLRRVRNDLSYLPLRGNVDTRLAKLERGDYEAIVLAYAGVRRLGLADARMWPIPFEHSVPAVGQGALAIEARADDDHTLRMLSAIDDRPSHVAVQAERAFLTKLGGDCHVPLAGYARFDDGEARLRFDGLVADPTDDRVLRASAEQLIASPEQATATALALGDEMATRLLRQGADELIARAHAQHHRQTDPRSAPS